MNYYQVPVETLHASAGGRTGEHWHARPPSPPDSQVAHIPIPESRWRLASPSSSFNNQSQIPLDSQPISRSASTPDLVRLPSLNQGPTLLNVKRLKLHADERRKRNAEASSRFRARRKDREQELAHEVQKLQGTVRELRNDLDFYREERDHFRRVFSACTGHPWTTSMPPFPHTRGGQGAWLDTVMAVEQPWASSSPTTL
ncbi:MAG: hypothetical protein M4579_005228 [Chaenotheca gracillima]|nr:MAG: hypothetical protein M4579_005228 [Chaenotheca gracillima]